MYYKIFSTRLIIAILFLGVHNTTDAQINTSPYEFTEIFRVGDEARGDTILLSAHKSSVIDVNSSNQMFVGSGWTPDIPVMSFSDEGHFIGFVGAKGEGPGEYKSSLSLVVAPGDSIYVFDWNFDRLSVFEPNTLKYAYSINVGASELSPSTPMELLGVTPEGYLFEYIMPFGAPGSEPDEQRYNHIHLVDRRGNISKESITKLPHGEVFVRASEEAMSVTPFPFGKNPFFTYKNGLLYAGWNDAIVISVISQDGDVLRTIKQEHETVRVTRKEIESKVSDFSKELRRAMLSSDLLPETKPAYDELVVDDQGQVWIREYPDTDSEFAKWLIIDPDSKLVGEMEFPTNLLLKAIKGGRAYASVNSEMYGPYIVVYEITE